MESSTSTAIQNEHNHCVVDDVVVDSYSPVNSLVAASTNNVDVAVPDLNCDDTITTTTTAAAATTDGINCNRTMEMEADKVAVIDAGHDNDDNTNTNTSSNAVKQVAQHSLDDSSEYKDDDHDNNKKNDTRNNGDQGNTSSNNDYDYYYENYINLALLHPNRYGWTAAGDIANVATPYYNASNEKHRKRSSTSQRRSQQSLSNSYRRGSTSSKKRNRADAFTTLSNNDDHSDDNQQQSTNGKSGRGRNHKVITKKGNNKSQNKRQTKKNFFMNNTVDSLMTATTTTTNPVDTKNDNNILLGDLNYTNNASISTTTQFVSSTSSPHISNDHHHSGQDKEDDNNKKELDDDTGRHDMQQQQQQPNVTITNPTRTIDVLSYYQGREKWDYHLHDTANTKIKDLKPMIATITIDIPLCDPQNSLRASNEQQPQTNNIDEYYRETIQWDLSDMGTPNPIIYAAQIGEQFGLSYPMIWDIAHSIQMQIHNYINDHCSYVAPVYIDPESTDALSSGGAGIGSGTGIVHQDSHRNKNAVVTVPHLYGEITGYLQQGGTCVPHVPRLRSSISSMTNNNGATSKTLLRKESNNTLTGRSLSSSQRSMSNCSARQQTNNNPRGRVKQESFVSTTTSARRRTVPKLPISEFPKEMASGVDKDYGFDIEYQTLFTAEGSFLVTTENNNASSNTTQSQHVEPEPSVTSTSPKPLEVQQPAIVTEDGSVDFCNVCKTVGNLLCCDFCPRAFHCQCIPSDAVPECMNDESKWECPSCVQERNGLPSDNITETPTLNSLIQVYNVDVDDSMKVQHVTVLSILFEMLRTLIEYDFGDVFRSPVDCSEIPTYRTIVKHPMDLGTILKNLESGRYDNKSLEGIVLAVLKDIELVWHNCFIFNVEGSAVYRMANIHKRRAYSIRQRSFDHMISDRVKNELADYITSLELERDNHRRLDALAIQSRSIEKPTTSISSSNEKATKTPTTTTSTATTTIIETKQKRAIPSKISSKNRPVAVLDADSGRIMKIYTSMNAASTAVNTICSLKRHECEWETHEIDSLNKMRKMILLCNADPNLRLFGYRWLCLESLRNRRIKFANPKSKTQQQADVDVENALQPPEKLVKEEFVGLISDGKSFFYHSIVEALSYPDLVGNIANLEERLETLVSGAEFETVDGNMWKRSDPVDFVQCGIEFVKEDVVMDDNTLLLCGFADIVAAHRDWCHTLDASFTSPEDDRSMDVFTRFYLDQDRNVDGIRWRRIQPRPGGTIKNGIITKNSCDVTINTSTTSVSGGIRQDTSSTDTHSTADNSNTSRVYDVQRIPSPKCTPTGVKGVGSLSISSTTKSLLPILSSNKSTTTASPYNNYFNRDNISIIPLCENNISNIQNSTNDCTNEATATNGAGDEYKNGTIHEMNGIVSVATIESNSLISSSGNNNNNIHYNNHYTTDNPMDQDCVMEEIYNEYDAV